MGKYSRLGEFLRSQRTKEVPMTFTEIERVIGDKLPQIRRNIRPGGATIRRTTS